jgi:hypothetical protein
MSEIERPPPDDLLEGEDSRSPSGRALDTLVVEARAHLDVGGAARGKDALEEVDWSRLESRLMTEIEKETPQLLGDLEPRRSTRWLRAGAVVLAAAAAVALFVRKDRDVALTNPSPTPSEGAPAGSLRATEGAGEVRIGGIVATPGSVVRAADAIDVDGARAVFERPNKVSWLVEQDAPGLRARARVKSAGEPLVLDLEVGAIEAQVVPVPAGEAFAVDIATERNLVRVAVHGTHLRVVRSGNRVVVDLTEGVVSIGVPPRTGMTYGTTVTAPAHVELDATDLATLRIDRAPGSVRAAVPLGAHGATRNESATSPTEVVQLTPPPSSPKAATPHAEGPSAAKHDPPKAVLCAREAIAAAVRECAAARGRSGNVQITVSSRLLLHVSPAGTVESAQFSPPLSPVVQTCAARVIYKTKLDEPGAVTIPIEFSY